MFTSSVDRQAARLRTLGGGSAPQEVSDGYYQMRLEVGRKTCRNLSFALAFFQTRYPNCFPREAWRSWIDNRFIGPEEAASLIEDDLPTTLPGISSYIAEAKSAIDSTQKSFEQLTDGENLRQFERPKKTGREEDPLARDRRRLHHWSDEDDEHVTKKRRWEQ